MKKLLLSILLFLPCLVIQAIEVHKLDGKDRSMIVYAPDDLPEGAPLFISCHGMSQDAPFQQDATKFNRLADEKKFVVVYPNGINNSWDLSGMKDINFMDAIINEMVQRYKINRSRVYINGFSMGGMFTYYCANKMADRIAAFCPVSGYAMGGPNATASRAVPIMHTHGTSDDVCSYSPVQSHIDAWVAFNKCNKTPNTLSPYPPNTNSPAVMKKYRNGTDGVEVWLLTLKDKGHWWSMDTNQAVTTDEVYNFCMKWELDNPAETTTTFEIDESAFDEIDESVEYERQEVFDANLDSAQPLVGEGIPSGWKRVTASGSPVEQNTANCAGVRMKYFTEGGDFNSGFYLSARDVNRCDLYYGTYDDQRLYLEPGLYEVTFNSIYWSRGAFDAQATFAFNVLNSSLTKVKGSSSFKPTGCVDENSAQQIKGSKAFTARFEIKTAGNFVLDFAMDQGWNSVIVGNIKVYKLISEGVSIDQVKAENHTATPQQYNLQGMQQKAGATGFTIQNERIVYIK